MLVEWHMLLIGGNICIMDEPSKGEQVGRGNNGQQVLTYSIFKWQLKTIHNLATSSKHGWIVILRTHLTRLITALSAAGCSMIYTEPSTMAAGSAYIYIYI